ncbi:N-acetylmuramoyl-L-alanine amidase [Mariniblastus fucicola]|nr:N-acetylmuramoyl-L-alanine amidase [Mariniblastus fucicola]
MQKRKRYRKSQSYEPLEPRRLLTCNHVVLDPGHGGNSSADDLSGSTWNGATSTSGLLEKDLVLELGERVRQALVDQGFEVSMTRTENFNLSAADRAAVARDLVSDDTNQIFFLSLHFNELNSQRRGTETFYADNPDSTNFNLAQDQTFAGIIQKSILAGIKQFGGVDREVKPDSNAQDSPLEVLSDVNFGNSADRQAVISALAEIDFIDNRDVDAILTSEYRRDMFFGEIARGIAAGIDKAQQTFCEQSSIVEVIDRSDSMDTEGRIEATKTAASRLVGLVDDGVGIGIVSYASDATTDYQLTKITDQTIREEAFQAIDAIQPGGLTAISEGVRLADIELDRFANDDNQAMIVMTDGSHSNSEDPTSVIESEVDQGVRVFTIGLGDDADAQTLHAMANARNGEFFHATASSDLNRIHQLIHGEVSGALTILDSRGQHSEPGFEQYRTFQVDPSTTSTTIGLSWVESDIDLEVISPSGAVYNRHTIESQLDAKFASGDGFESLEIAFPESGYWSARVSVAEEAETGTDYNVLIQNDSILSSSAMILNELAKTTTVFETGQSATLALKLEDVSAVVNATVFARVTAPNGLVYRIELLDDATNGDEIAGDGIYTVEFDDLNTAGHYHVRYEVSGYSSFSFPFTAIDSRQIFAFGEDAVKTEPPRVTNVYSRAETIGSVSPQENALLIARFVDVDPGESYSATIDWGDGVQETIEVQDIGDRYEIRANHSYTSAGRFPVSIVFSDGSDTTMTSTYLYVSGTGLYGDTVFVIGSEGSDTIKIFDRGPQLEVLGELNGQAESSQRFELSDVSRVRVYSGDGNDHVTSQSQTVPLEAWLGDGDDRAVGSLLGDYLLGQSGDDTIYGRDGDDRINAGPGTNQVFGGFGNDHLAGGSGDDLIYGDLGNDTIHGLAGNDRLYGQSGNDLISGGAGDDQIWGGDDDDEVYGLYGMDLIIGGLGSDSLFGSQDSDEIYGSPGDDWLDGGPGIDLLDGGPGDDREVNGEL